MRLVLTGLLLILMIALQQLHERFLTDPDSRAALVFGFLLLSGFLLGEIVARFLPRISGYLVVGMLLGPDLLGVVDSQTIARLELIDELALVLIAYTAGAELKVRRLAERARGILAISLAQVVVVSAFTLVGLWLFSSRLPFLASLAAGPLLAVTAVLGIVSAATSPATTVAVVVENRARGPLTDCVLGTSVLADLLVLVGFTGLMILVRAQFSGDAAGPDLGLLALELGLSPVLGVGFGYLMIAYLRFVGRQKVLFVLGSAFLAISLARAFSLELLLLAVAAGFTVGNFSRQGSALTEGLEQASGPVFLIFFCLAGARLDLGLLRESWALVLLLVGLRTAGAWTAGWTGAWLAREPATIRRWAWSGLLGQAGVSLGLAAMVRAGLPEVGPVVADLIIGSLAINQVLGPVVLRWALVRAGEAAGSSLPEPGRIP